MHANKEECDKAGLDYREVKKLARNLESAAVALGEMGVTVFGNNGCGQLLFNEKNGRGDLIVARINGTFDGGDPGTDEDRLERIGK